MQQIVDWLEKLGMSEYAQRFVENRIDLSVLPNLTDQDLEKLGVLLGDRRKLLRAIRDLGNASVAAMAMPATTEPARQDHAERRQLTIMFCDLVGLYRVIGSRSRGVAGDCRRLSPLLHRTG